MTIKLTVGLCLLQGQRYKAKFDPRVMAKYDIKALIGRGTFSRVVRVEHRMTRQPYAIKTVDRNRGREMCEAELVVLRRVRHNYIIRLIEVKFIIMPLP